MKLYNFDPSPNPLKVRLALAEMGLEYERTLVNLFQGEQREENFLRVNPMGQIPVLQDGTLTLRESNAILAYLGREYGKDLWPTGPAQESVALQWLFFESCELIQAAGRIWWADIVVPAVGRVQPAAHRATDALEDLKRPLAYLEQLFEKQPFVMGPDFSLVDCAIGVTLNMLRGTRADQRTTWPNVTEYRESIRARASWNEATGDAIHNLRRPGR
jgi:glutathione S-transferase